MATTNPEKKEEEAAIQNPTALDKTDVDANVSDSDANVSDDDAKTLRRVADSLPPSVFLVCVAEMAERFTYRCLTGPLRTCFHFSAPLYPVLAFDYLDSFFVVLEASLTLRCPVENYIQNARDDPLRPGALGRVSLLWPQSSADHLTADVSIKPVGPAYGYCSWLLLHLLVLLNPLVRRHHCRHVAWSLPYH